MIGASRHRETIAELQAAVTTLTAQLATLASEVAMLSAQSVAEVERSATRATVTAALATRVDQLQALSDAQAADLVSQSDRIDFLSKEGERLQESVRQCRGDLSRIDRQAVIDLSEMRNANVALASSILQQTHRSAPATAVDGQE